MNMPVGSLLQCLLWRMHLSQVLTLPDLLWLARRLLPWTQSQQQNDSFKKFVYRSRLSVTRVPDGTQIYPRRISQLRIVEFQRADGMAG